MNYVSKIARHILPVLGLCIVSTDYVMAQDSVIEEILVTARKRSERLQDVPASVTAFNSQTIEQAGIEGMRDFALLTTNMNLVETQNSGFAFVNIRGLSTIRNVDPTVAVVIDGVLSTTSLGFSQDLYDVQQIEVLKGPQGALYGRNATGGAISIVTKQPTTETETFIRAGFGDGNFFTASGGVSGALSGDSLLGRLVVGYRDADGWRDNITTGVEADPYEDLSVRGKLVWNVSDSMSVDLRLSFSDTTAGGAAFVSNAPNFVGGNTIFGSPANIASTPGNGVAPILPGVPGPIATLIGDPNNTSVQVQSNEPGIDEREMLVLSAKIDWGTNFGTITSVTAYDELDAVTAADNFAYYPFLENPGALAALNNTFGQNRFHEAFSQELRLTSNDDQRLRWIFGGYFADTQLDTMISTNIDQNLGIVKQGTAANIGTINDTNAWNSRFLAAAVPAFNALFNAVPALVPPACQAGGGGPLAGINIPVCAALLANPNANPAALAINYDRAENTAYAVFGQVNYDISDNVELSVALRYDRDDREITVRTPQSQLPTFPFPGAFEGEIRSDDFDSLQPKVTLRWQPNDTATLYGTYAEGFRSGGFNLSGVSAGVAALASAGVPGMPQGVSDQWQQEDTESFELGYKGVFQDGRLNLRGSIFQTDVENAFTFTFVAQLTAQVTRNIRDVEIQGAEIDANWLANEHLQFDFGFGWLDSEIKASDWVGAGGINLVGKEMPYSPETSLNIGITLSNEFAGDWDSFFRVDYQRLGEMYFEVENFAARDALDLVNFRAGVANASNGWEFAIWGKNVTDENYIADLTNPNGIVYYGRLRQFGVEATKRFGGN